MFWSVMSDCRNTSTRVGDAKKFSIGVSQLPSERRSPTSTCAIRYGITNSTPGTSSSAPAMPKSRRRRARTIGSPSASRYASMSSDRDDQKHAAVAAGQHLKREKRDRQKQIAPPSAVQIRVQRSQRERNPLDRREMELAEAEKTRRREREDEPRQHGGGRAQADAAAEHVRAEPAQHARQQRDDVHGEHRVAGEPQHRRGEERAADEIFRVRQRVAMGIKDVRVEDRQRLVHERVGVPCERPHEEMSVRIVGGQRPMRGHRQRVREQQGQDGVEGSGPPLAWDTRVSRCSWSGW